VLEEYEELREEHYAGLEERTYVPIDKVKTHIHTILPLHTMFYKHCITVQCITAYYALQCFLRCTKVRCISVYRHDIARRQYTLLPQQCANITS
jgi:hypothetical protein